MQQKDQTRLDMIGEIISHYRILERLGAGGMGEVYKAEDVRLHRTVALKMLLRGLQENEEARKRLLREAQAASALNHPNIATIYEVDDVERDGERHIFIVMEYVSGRTLSDFARSKDLSTAEALDIVLQIADALSEAHGRGIVHRDVKPSNVIITENRRVKVLDFGLAKFRALAHDKGDLLGVHDTELVKTMPGTVMGTLSYMSPEQALGKEVDGRSDIFSLGVLFYELLTGRLPFAGESSLVIVDGILHAEPPAPSRFNYQLTQEVERVTYKMLQKDRELRYQSLREVYLDLNAARRQMAEAAAKQHQSRSSQKTQVLPDRATETGPHSLSSRKGKSLAVMTFTNITKNSDDDWLGMGIAETVTADLKNIEGVTVIGRERIYEVLRNIQADHNGEPDEKLSARVGREVGARWIVSGGYQRIGDLLRITARFVEVDTGEVIKTVKIDGRMSEIFELQDKIVYELSRNLQVSLRSSERKVIEQEETQVLEAYEAFTKGMINLRVGSTESLDRAILLFDKAIGLDPQYARAYSSLGAAYELKAEFLAMPELFERAIANYQKAIELRPHLADSYRGLGMVFVYLGREDEAIGAIRRSLAFAPQDFGSHAALGRAYFIGKGQFPEAAAEYEKALALNPKAGWVALQLAYCYALMGEPALGEKAARTAISLQEQFLSGKEGMQIIGAHTRLGHILYLEGRYEEAIAEFNRELEFLGQTNHALKDRAAIEVNQRLGSTLVRQGKSDQARPYLEQAVKGFQQRLQMGADEPFTRYYVACAYAMMGDREKALECLEKAVQVRPRFSIERARLDKDFESLRDNPRFQTLVNPSSESLQ